MKLVKITTATTSNYPFDWSKNTKEQFLGLNRDDLEGSYLVANCYEDRGGFMVQIFVETQNLALVNIDNIFRFTPSYKPTISGKSGGTVFELDKEVFEKLQELECRPASYAVGKIEMKNAEGKPVCRDVAGVSWTDINDQEMYEEVTDPVRDYHERLVSNYNKIGEMLSEK